MLIRLNVDKVSVDMRLSWGWADGGGHLVPSHHLYVISVGHEGEQSESWKFYYICKKGH